MTRAASFEGITVLERGWLSSNNVLLHNPPGEGALLVDSSHCLHSEQTLALLDKVLAQEPLRRLVNTHLHSDHCGGNAAVQRHTGCTISVPPGHFEAALRWDDDALGYAYSGQTCERFAPDDRLRPGESVAGGGRVWTALAAPGHDPHSLILFDATQGVLISADALWEQGFGVVFPEIEGEPGFDEVAQTLDLIESLDARSVIPGHGAPFSDVPAALQRARRRLDSFVAEPERHSWHGAKVMIKYHLLEVRRQRWPDFEAWLAATPIFERAWLQLGRPEGGLPAFGQRLVRELADRGALTLADGCLLDA